ncbi:hypothetical protein F5X98DRAFT_359312, partial [Xylaria grammica]
MQYTANGINNPSTIHIHTYNNHHTTHAGTIPTAEPSPSAPQLLAQPFFSAEKKQSNKQTNQKVSHLSLSYASICMHFHATTGTCRQFKHPYAFLARPFARNATTCTASTASSTATATATTTRPSSVIQATIAHAQYTTHTHPQPAPAVRRTQRNVTQLFATTAIRSTAICSTAYIHTYIHTYKPHASKPSNHHPDYRYHPQGARI